MNALRDPVNLIDVKALLNVMSHEIRYLYYYSQLLTDEEMKIVMEASNMVGPSTVWSKSTDKSA